MAAKSPVNGYEGVYQWVRERLAACDLAAGALHLRLMAVEVNRLSLAGPCTASRSGGWEGDA